MVFRALVLDARGLEKRNLFRQDFYLIRGDKRETQSIEITRRGFLLTYN